MAKRIQDGKLLYHMTSLYNLKSIFTNGLLSRHEVLNKKISIENIADDEIIQIRQKLNIDNFIPFHFFEKTPFAGTVLKTFKSTHFCYITVLRTFAQKSNWLICNAHPLSSQAKIFDYNTGLQHIDWVSAEQRNFFNDKSKNACMAECLAQSPVYPNAFFCIFVKDRKSAKYVEDTAIEIMGIYPFDVWTNEVFF